eukprot:532367-Pelagomonas_calceolata.AAC.2
MAGGGAWAGSRSARDAAALYMHPAASLLKASCCRVLQPVPSPEMVNINIDTCAWCRLWFLGTFDDWQVSVRAVLCAQRSAAKPSSQRRRDAVHGSTPC